MKLYFNNVTISTLLVLGVAVVVTGSTTADADADAADVDICSDFKTVADADSSTSTADADADANNADANDDGLAYAICVEYCIDNLSISETSYDYFLSTTGLSSFPCDDDNEGGVADVGGSDNDNDDELVNPITTPSPTVTPTLSPTATPTSSPTSSPTYEGGANYIRYSSCDEMINTENGFFTYTDDFSKEEYVTGGQLLGSTTSFGNGYVWASSTNLTQVNNNEITYNDSEANVFHTITNEFTNYGYCTGGLGCDKGMSLDFTTSSLYQSQISLGVQLLCMKFHEVGAATETAEITFGGVGGGQTPFESVSISRGTNVELAIAASNINVSIDGIEILNNNNYELVLDEVSIGTTYNYIQLVSSRACN